MGIRIASLSVMVGSPACNLNCGFCVSKTTYRKGSPTKTKVPLDRIDFLANQFLRVCDGIPYGIITGKGEPTLAPKEEIGDLIWVLYNNGKGLAPEMQTNGTRLNHSNLQYWKDKGLNTIAISCVSHDDDVNSGLLSKGNLKWDLSRAVADALDVGLMVRLTPILCKKGIDSPDSLLAFMGWAKQLGVHQITFRKMGLPRDLVRPGSSKIASYIKANHVDPSKVIIPELRNMAEEKTPWPWALRFGWEGMSVIVTEHLTEPKQDENDPGIEQARHSVIQDDGGLYLSWDDPSSRVL
ncbi:MAG: hypothetical protein HQ564_05820 [Candidatus Saganbacteria bacterium]|nr:hypothetical protein [Candidatus Saganbacteria bacterium]